MCQILKLMNMTMGYVGAQAQVFHGIQWSSWRQARTIRLCRAGLLDAVVVSVKSGKNGCNLQGMKRMVSLRWIPASTEEEQCKGMVIY